MSEYKIITISRQFGSGGHEIGEKLAERLGIPLYDNQLVTMAAEKLGYTEESVGRADESALNAFISSYSASSMRYASFINTASYMPSLDMKVYQKQTEIILSLAEKGPCVIVGRCADYILQGKVDLLTVFIHADMKFRADRIVRLYGESDDSPERRLKQKDKRRAAYYRYYTDIDWGVAKNYDIALDSGRLGIDKCVELITGLY